jgi:hypothetical protein
MMTIVDLLLTRQEVPHNMQAQREEIYHRLSYASFAVADG